MSKTSKKPLPSGKDIVAANLASGELLTSNIKDTLASLEVGQTRIVGPLSRRSDIGPFIARFNENRPTPATFVQSRCYCFYPDAGITVKLVLVTRTA